MRISDWSSDVCSSDLSPERIGVGEIAVLAEQVGNDRKPARLDIEQRMIDLDRRAPEQPFLQLMAGRAISVGVVIKDKPRLLLALARQGQVTHGRDRSEEHTSELQSLMRISYAVFCLKKKN